MDTVTIDFIAKDQSHGGWSLVLVEEGPWESDEIEHNLRRIQDRLYNCLDIVLDGKLAERYPESSGKPVAIRLDAFNVPEEELHSFFSSFAQNVMNIPDYATALEQSVIIPRILFSLNVEKVRS
jgi:hypothetical protein